MEQFHGGFLPKLLNLAVLQRFFSPAIKSQHKTAKVCSSNCCKKEDCQTPTWCHHIPKSLSSRYSTVYFEGIMLHKINSTTINWKFPCKGNDRSVTFHPQLTWYWHYNNLTLFFLSRNCVKNFVWCGDVYFYSFLPLPVSFTRRTGAKP